jgi:hypothetical protein
MSRPDRCCPHGQHRCGEQQTHERRRSRPHGPFGHHRVRDGRDGRRLRRKRNRLGGRSAAPSLQFARDHQRMSSLRHKHTSAEEDAGRHLVTPLRSRSRRVRIIAAGRVAKIVHMAISIVTGLSRKNCPKRDSRMSVVQPSEHRHPLVLVAAVRSRVDAPHAHLIERLVRSSEHLEVR